MRPLPTMTNADGRAARIAASKASSRMSIERYLSAPLEEEAASLPAINAALLNQKSRQTKHSRKPSRTSHHSLESSWDVNSDGRRTFYTSGSVPDSSGTSYSLAPKSGRVTHHQRSRTHPNVPYLPKLAIPEYENSQTVSPERPTTSGTIDMEKIWAEQMGTSSSVQGQGKADYRLKAQQEIERIQEKASHLEDQIQSYQGERNAQRPPAPSVTDEMAYAQMARQPKLAWILGGDVSDLKSIERPKSNGSVLTGITDVSGRPSSSGTVAEPAQHRMPRRSKSNGALDEKAREAILEKRSAGFFTVKPRRRARFFCTFCQKRFHSRVGMFTLQEAHQ